MASIQQLEKLHQVQRLFQADQSLESIVASQRVQTALSKTEQLIKQRSFLREERRRLRVSSEKLEERKRAMKFISQSDFIGEHLKQTEREKRIRINVGGLVFETLESVLKKDPGSLLSQLCDPENPPLMPDPDGYFVFNRDWWLFRYILAFLRDGTLPDDRKLLAQLYQEASFWNVKELMNAIELEKLHLHENPKSGKDGKPIEKKFWQKIPSWWRSVIEVEAEVKKKSSKKPDWWTDKINKDDPITVSPTLKDSKGISLDVSSTWSEADKKGHCMNDAYSVDATAEAINERERDLLTMLEKKHPPLPKSRLPPSVR